MTSHLLPVGPVVMPDLSPDQLQVPVNAGLFWLTRKWDRLVMIRNPLFHIMGRTRPRRYLDGQHWYDTPIALVGILVWLFVALLDRVESNIR